MADLGLSRVVVPDTSVILKWFLHEQEPEQSQALALFDSYLEGRVHLLVPDLLPYEAANVLRYKPNWDADRVTLAIGSLFALGLEIMPVSLVLTQRAVALAYDYGVTVYDAAFVVLAAEQGADFVTADEKLIRRLRELAHVRSLRELPYAPNTAGGSAC